MRVFVTGATGFIGTHLVAELIAAGHRVTGLSRSNGGAVTLARAGADVLRGNITDLALIRDAAAESDAVIHAAFNHDPADQRLHSENDRRAIEALGQALTGSSRRLIVTSGTALVRSRTNSPVIETDDHAAAAEFPRAATEEAADELIAKGMCATVVRLPQVHDEHRQGRITWQIQAARRNGRVIYVGEGNHRVPAVHVSDLVTLYRMVVEHAQPLTHYHAVAEEGVTLREIAAVVGAGLNLPVESVTVEEARRDLGRLGDLLTMNLAASSRITREQLGWRPCGPNLLDDLRATDYNTI